MRIASNDAYQRALDGILRIGRANAETQAQIASGFRILTPADDPVAAGQILKLEQGLALRGQYTRNLDVVENSLGLSEAVLGNAVEVLQRVRELTITAGSGSNTRTDRRFIAAEVATRLDELVDIANTRSASGDYIFGGHASGGAPVVEDRGRGFVYRGDQGQRELQISSSARVAVTDNGEDIFMLVPAAAPTFTAYAHGDNHAAATIAGGRVIDVDAFATLFPDDAVITFEPPSAIVPPGPNYSVRRLSDNRIIGNQVNVPLTADGIVAFAGITAQIHGAVGEGDRFAIETSDRQSAFTTLRHLQTELHRLDDGGADQLALERVVASTLQNIDSALEAIVGTRAAIGARLNTATSTRDLHEEVDLVANRVVSNLRDLDYTEAVSRLSQQAFVLEAAQKSYARIASLSLFNSL